MMSLLKPILVTALLIALSGRAWGCDCRMPGSPEEAAMGATVFVGEVTEIVGRDETFDPERWIFPRQILRFRVIDLIKTPHEEKADFIDVLTGMGGGDCGLGAPKGSIYLIYAHPSRDSSDRLETNICMRSKPVAQAAEDLKAFGRRMLARPER